MEPAFQDYFQDRGMILQRRGRNGQHEPDWSATDSSGMEFPVEEKEQAEIGCYSQWWSYWSGILVPRYQHTNLHLLPSQVRGWIAVIDGELNDWVQLAQSGKGYAVAECAGRQFGSPRLTVKASVDLAVEFLSHHSGLLVTDAAVLASGHYVIAVRYSRRD